MSADSTKKTAAAKKAAPEPEAPPAEPEQTFEVNPEDTSWELPADDSVGDAENPTRNNEGALS